MSTNKHFFIKAGPLFLVLFIDGMGLSLIMPILNALIFAPDSQFFAGRVFSPGMHSFIYGAITSVFMLCWFFGAALLGDMSDYIGRKKALTLCLLGAGLGYLISAFAVITNSITLLLLGRIVGGFTAGSQPIAQAAIVDLSTNENKARNIGLILLAISLGFILGPLLGGLLSDNRLVAWFDFATPFYFAAFISLANIGLLWILFNESFTSAKGKFPFRPQQAIYIFVSAFKHEKVKQLSVLFFIFIFGWSSFYSFIALFLIKTYDFSPTRISMYMAVMGLGFGLGTGFVVQYLARRFPLKQVFIYTVLSSAILTAIVAILPFEWVGWLLLIPLACSVAVAYSAIVTLFSDQVEADKQGWVMGITGSIMALVWALNGVSVGIIAAWSAHLPLFISAICFAIVVIYERILYKTQNLPEIATDQN